MVPVNVRILFFGRRSTKSFARYVTITARISTSDATQLTSFVTTSNNYHQQRSLYIHIFSYYQQRNTHSQLLPKIMYSCSVVTHALISKYLGYNCL